MKDLYNRGILRKAEIRNPWKFNDEAIEMAQILGLGSDGDTILAETLIKFLEKLDVVFELNGLLGDESSGSVDEYSLVPEVWSYRLDETQDNGRATVDMRALSSKCNTLSHMMMGWEVEVKAEMKVEVKGGLLSNFYPKFVCRCTTVLAEMNGDLWMNGRVTLGRNARQWVSGS